MDEQPAVRKKWRAAISGNVLMMGLVSFFTDASSEMIYPLLPVFTQALVGVEYTAIYLAMMEGVAETTASLLKIFSGRLSDAVGKRKVLVVVGYGISTIVRPLIGLAAAGWTLVGLRFLDRVGKGIRTSPRDALIGESVDGASRGLAFSFHRAMDHAGAVVGPIVAMVLMVLLVGQAHLWKSGGSVGDDEVRGLRVIFGLALIPGLLAMAVLVFKVREIAPAGGVRTGKFTGRFAGWRELPGKFFGFVGIVSLFYLGNSSDIFILYYGYTLLHMGIEQLLLLWVLLHVSKIVFSVPGGLLSDRIGRRPIIIAGWVGYALIYLGFANVSAAHPWMFWALFVAYGFYFGMCEGVEKAVVADFVPAPQYGTAFGVYHAAVGIAALPANLMFGILWTTLNPRLAFGVGAGLAALASVLLAMLISTTPPRAAEAS